MGSYGMSQSLLRYETWKFKHTLDHVFYVHYENDVREDVVRGVFRLDDAGQLTRLERPSSIVWRFFAKMHLSYLALDATGRLTTLLGAADTARQLVFFRPWRVHNDYEEAQQSALVLFRQQLRRFKAAAEQDGASFTLVYLPMENYAASGVSEIVRAEGVETINLRDCFGEHDPAHLQTPWIDSPYRFRRDKHWNEAGNRLAAVCLHHFLVSRLGLPRLPKEEIGQALARYYSAFDALAENPRLEHGNGQPTAEPAWAAIGRKYNTLERNSAKPQTPWEPSPDKLAIRSDVDVYLHDGWLAYARKDCQVDNSYLGFYLHVYPVDAQDLPAHRLRWGFDNLDFWHFFHEPPCMAWRTLPDYPIAHIITGGLSAPGTNPNHEKTWGAKYVIAN